MAVLLYDLRKKGGGRWSRLFRADLPRLPRDMMPLGRPGYDAAFTEKAEGLSERALENTIKRGRTNAPLLSLSFIAITKEIHSTMKSENNAAKQEQRASRLSAFYFCKMRGALYHTFLYFSIFIDELCAENPILATVERLAALLRA